MQTCKHANMIHHAGTHATCAQQACDWPYCVVRQIENALSCRVGSSDRSEVRGPFPDRIHGAPSLTGHNHEATCLTGRTHELLPWTVDDRVHMPRNRPCTEHALLLGATGVLQVCCNCCVRLVCCVGGHAAAHGSEECAAWTPRERVPRKNSYGLHSHGIYLWPI